MKYLAPIFIIIALIQYTAPNGNAVFVNPEQIIAVTAANNDCQPNANARIVTSRGDTCVRETQDQVVQTILLWGPSK